MIKEPKHIDYACPYCKKELPVPFRKSGSWQVFPSSVSCPGCMNDVSKKFFEYLVQEKTKFKWESKAKAKPKAKPAKVPKKKAPKLPRKKKIVHLSAEKDVPKKDLLTPKERIAIAAHASGASKKDSLLLAGYAQTTAGHRPDIVFGKVRVMKAMRDILDDQGATDEKLAEVLIAGLEASKVISAMVIAPDGEGMADAHSMTKDFVEVVDFKERRESAVVLLKLRGHLSDKKKEEKPFESFEQRFRRLGLDKMPAHEALVKRMKEVYERICNEHGPEVAKKAMERFGKSEG